MNQVTVQKGKDPLGVLRAKPQPSDCKIQPSSKHAYIIAFSMNRVEYWQRSIGSAIGISNSIALLFSECRCQYICVSCESQDKPASGARVISFNTVQQAQIAEVLPEFSSLLTKQKSTGKPSVVVETPPSQNSQPVNPQLVHHRKESDERIHRTGLSESFEKISKREEDLQKKEEEITAAAAAAAAASKADMDYKFQELRAEGISREFIIRGEELKGVSETALKFGQQYFEGSLIITNYKLIFIASDQDRFLHFFNRKEFSMIPLGIISKVERSSEKKGIQYAYLDISCKDGRVYRFKYVPEFATHATEMMNKINYFAFPEDVLKSFAYLHAEKELEDTHQGWSIYDIYKEFQRQALPILALTDASDIQTPFRYLDNSNGVICSTYPRLLVVPTKMNNDEVIKCSRFRSKERLPVLTFGFKKRNSKYYTTLWRCAQCKPGVSQNRSADDELMLRVIGCLEGNSQIVRTVKIYDARPYLNAVGQQITGKGYEMKQFYKNCEIEFLDIHNIHKVRDSYKKLTSALASATSSDYLKELEKSEWLLHLSTILEGARNVVDSLMSEMNVVVHCSDGWDRTAQLIALAQICIDPYFRTIQGFQVLIEKDWVSFGHMFGNRCGHASKNHSDDQRSPIFVQFLDAVFQLTDQFPLSFEFNSRFLADIAAHLYSNRFGTFLHNYYQVKETNEEQYHYNVANRTTSLWSYLAAQRYMYENPFYLSADESNMTTIRPDGHVKRLTVWKDHFMFFQPGSADPYRIYNECFFAEDNRNVLKRTTQMKYEQYKQENRMLNKRIEELEAKLLQSKQETTAALNLSGVLGNNEQLPQQQGQNSQRLSLNPMMASPQLIVPVAQETSKENNSSHPINETIIEIIESVPSMSNIPNLLNLPSLSNLDSNTQQQQDLLSTNQEFNIDISGIEGSESCKNAGRIDDGLLESAYSNAALDEACVEDNSYFGNQAEQEADALGSRNVLPSKIMIDEDK